MSVKLKIDLKNQWFAFIWVSLNDRKSLVRSKIDTGCNALVLSRGTLKSLGYPADMANLSKLPAIPGVVVGGDSHIFRKLGAVSLYSAEKQAVHICNAQAICLPTHETHDLLGTEVFCQFSDVEFKLTGDRRIVLRKNETCR